MPIIAITAYSNGKIIALTCSCTQAEYEQHMKTGDINEYTVSGTFLREYLALSGYPDEKLKELRKADVTTENGFQFEWIYASVISVPDLKEILNRFGGMPYDRFIESYADHLKSL